MLKLEIANRNSSFWQKRRKNEAILFKKGEIIRKIPQDEIIGTLKNEILTNWGRK